MLSPPGKKIRQIPVFLVLKNQNAYLANKLASATGVYLLGRRLITEALRHEYSLPGPHVVNVNNSHVLTSIHQCMHSTKYP